MVAIVSGNSLGLSLSSLQTLGPDGQRGTGSFGRSGEGAFVNIATGNLVLQRRDDYLASYGTDISVLRTYNSRGELTGGATSTWALGTVRQRVDYAAGTNTMSRTDRDEAKAVYTWDATRALYVTTAGAGADDTLSRNADGSSVWTDGATGLREFYDLNGRLTRAEDPNGNALSYQYDSAGRLASVDDASGESVVYTWDANSRLVEIADRVNGSTVSQVRYGWDGSGRLASVALLLDADNPASTYTTQYDYDGGSQRVSRVTQSDGSVLAISYTQLAPDDWRVASTTDALQHVTTYFYDTANRITTVIDPVGQASRYHYNPQGELTRVETGDVASLAGSTGVGTATVTVTQVAVGQGTDSQGRSILSWAAPEAGTDSTFRYRLQGASSWQTLAITTTGMNQSVLLPVAAAGTFEFELLQAPQGSNLPTGRAIGTFTTAQVGSGQYVVQAVAVAAIGVQITGDTAAGTSAMSWAQPAAGIVSAWRYRPAGDAQAAWTTLNVQDAAGSQSVNLSGIAPGSYEFDLLQTNAQGMPVAQATGSLTLYATQATGSSGTSWAPATPVAVGTNASGQAQLSWAAPPAGTTTVASYRTAGGAWQALNVTLDAQTGKQVALLTGVAAGSYEYKVEQSGTSTLTSTGRMDVLPMVAAHTEPVQVTVSIIPVTGSSSGLGWPVAPGDATVTLRYRAANTTAWTTYSDKTTTANGIQSVAMGKLPNNTWLEFEVVQTPNGSTVPTAHATGIYYAATGATTPTINLGRVVRYEDNSFGIAGPTLTTRTASVSVPDWVTAREVTPVVTAGNNASGQPQLSWDRAPAGTSSTLQYKNSGGSWVTLSTSIDDASGKQIASLAGLPAGTYDYKLVQAGGIEVTVNGSVQVFATVDAGSTVQAPIAILPVTTASNALSWPASQGGATTTFRYRERGKNWQTYTGTYTYANGVKTIPAGSLPGGGGGGRLYEFEILETPAGGGNPTAYATGTINRGAGASLTLALGEVGLSGNEFVIVGPTPTTRAITVATAYSPAPQLVGATTFTTPTYKPLPTTTSTTAATRDGSVWQPAPIVVNAFTQTAATTAQIATRYYTNAAGIAGLRDVRSFGYNARGDVTSIADAAGAATSFEYDARGNLTLQRDAVGNTVTRTYNAANRVTSQTTYLVPDPDGAGAVQPSGALATYSIYDSATGTQLLFEVSAQGRVTQHLYASAAHGERTSTLVYSAAAFSGTADLASLNAWAAQQGYVGASRSDMGYDLRGQLQTVTRYASLQANGEGTVDGSESVVRYVYNPDGSLNSVMDVKGGATTYTYDVLGRLLTSTNALLQQTIYSYDDAGGRSSVTQANGLTTTNIFDKAGHLLASTQGSAGNVNLGTTRYAYDAAGRLVMTTDPTGARNFVLYDAQGRRVAEVDGNGTLTEHFFDAADRESRSLQYATAVNLAALVNAQGQALTPALSAIRPAASAQDASTWRAYDSAGRLAATVDATGAVVAYSYDGASRLIATRQYATQLGTSALTALGNAPLPDAIAPTASATDDRFSRSFYDADGLMLATLDAEGYLQERAYDAAGRLVRTTRYANATPPSQRASGTLAQLRPATHADDATTIFFHDARGQLAAQIDAQGYLTEYTYDLSGHQTRVTQYATPVAAGYTSTSPLSALRPAASGEDRVSRFDYDALGRLAEETDPQGTITRYTYDAAGKLSTKTVGYGTAQARTLGWTHDLQSRLVTETTAEGAALQYAYDAAGRRVSSTDAFNNTTLYFYDSDGHLTHVVNAKGEVAETLYDTLGNRSSEVHYYNAISTSGLVGGLVTDTLRTRLAAARSTAKDASVQFSHDLRGLVTDRYDGEGVRTQFKLNAFGEIYESTRALGTSAAVTTRYTLDRRGLQTATVEDVGGLARTTGTRYDAFGRVEETTDANGNRRLRTYDRMGRVHIVTDPFSKTRRTEYDGFGRIVAQIDESNRATTYTYDQAGRSLAMTTPEGVTVTTTYDDFGQVQSVEDGNGNITTYSYDRDGRRRSPFRRVFLGRGAGFPLI